MSVLLENVMTRLERIENLLLVKNVTRLDTNGAIVGARELMAGVQETCELPADWKQNFPTCLDKLKWMESFWKSDTCYASHGVDGSRCSMLIYLGEVERHCPRFPWRPPPNPTRITGAAVDGPRAVPNIDKTQLFRLMADNAKNYNWIKGRIERMWPKWVEALHFIEQKQNWTLMNRKRKRILLHLGFLTKESGFKFGEKSETGGPLGELVQWADLIATLFLLGHQLVISSEIRTFKREAQADPSLKISCPVASNSQTREWMIDLIFTDIVGLRQMKRKIPGSLPRYKCKLRVLDSFGTQAEFNNAAYFTKHKKILGGKLKNPWGGHDLNLKQFNTMYPHSDDNTFLGFVVEMHSVGNNSATVSPDQVAEHTTDVRLNTSLVYGKEVYMWKNHEAYLDAVAELSELRATVGDASPPEAIHAKLSVNYGVVSGDQFHRLLRQSKLFIGLGFPYEGPAPLEAIANGAIFVNPVFKVPKGRRTDPFFAEKPTLRQLECQNPYALKFIGPPYVLSVDATNKTAVQQAITVGLRTRVVPYLPYEFTAPGMLERVNAHLEHQDFCTSAGGGTSGSSTGASWPPFSASHVLLAPPALSCQRACADKGYVCEPTYFGQLNRLAVLREYAACATSEESESTTAPAVLYDSGKKPPRCFLNSNSLLFSCASPTRQDVRRLCPCRDFIKDQVALCAACL